MKRMCLGLLLVVVADTARVASAKEVTRDQARQLVLKVLETQGTPTKSPKFDLEDNAGAVRYAPGFYFFDAYFDNPKRLATIGSYAVNRRTADVWEWIGCHRLDLPPVRLLQSSVRKEIGLTEQEHRKLSSVSPCQNH